MGARQPIFGVGFAVVSDECRNPRSKLSSQTIQPFLCPTNHNYTTFEEEYLCLGLLKGEFSNDVSGGSCTNSNAVLRVHAVKYPDMVTLTPHVEARSSTYSARLLPPEHRMDPQADLGVVSYSPGSFSCAESCPANDVSTTLRSPFWVIIDCD